MKREILASSRKLKRKRLFIKLTIFVVILILLAVGFVSLFYLDKFTIKEISIKTEADFTLDSKQIEEYVYKYLDDKYLGIVPLNNIFLFPKEKVISDMLEDFLRIKEVVLKKKLPGTIFLEINERKQDSLLCYKKEEDSSKNDCYFIDEDGFIFERSPFFSGTFFVKFLDKRSNAETFSIGDHFMEKDKYINLIKFKDLLKSDNIYVENIILKDEGIYHLVTSFDWYILINEKNTAKETFDNFIITNDTKIATDSRVLEYIDLRFGNKVFYKFK